MPVYPIGFSIHSSKIVEDVPEKKRLLSLMIPSSSCSWNPEERSYKVDNEKDYYALYKDSYFGVTASKGGWDCMRHYEILACGCIPYFPNLENCPSTAMTLFPKNVVLETNRLYEEVISKSVDPVALADELNLKDKYIKPLLEYTRNKLTNKAIAEYILNHLDKKVNRVLYLSPDLSPDYLRCLTLIGFKQLLGVECHDYPRIPHIYDDYPKDKTKQLYGMGLSYARVVSAGMHKEEYNATIKEDIGNHRYDVVIYGSYHRGMPLWEEVNATYEKKDIIMMCGEDRGHIYHGIECNSRDYSDQGYNVFVREL